MKQDDGELIRRWRAGEPAAFDALVRRWQQPVARFLSRLLGSAAPVADVCQELFLRVYLSRDRYREEGSFSAWLYRIALNLSRDHARRQARQPVSLREEVAAGSPATPHWERREIQEVVDFALGQLAPSLREVLVLRHYESMNFEDMGRLLGTPPSTLKSRFAVALRKLRDVLQNLGWDDVEKES
jgi:RNA polymerase sigma-70 factor, ECF subfamily